MSRRVLFTCWPFEGHVFPLLSIALAARERGDQVAFCTGRRLRPTVESQGIECFPFDRVEGAWERVHERERQLRGRRGSLRLQREAFRDWLVGSIPDQVDDVRTVIDRWDPDVIVTDGSMWGPSVVLHEAAGIPVVFASTLIYPLVPGPDAPLPGSGLGPPRGADRPGGRLGDHRRRRFRRARGPPAAGRYPCRARPRPTAVPGQRVDGQPAPVPGRQRARARLQPPRPARERALRWAAALASA